MPGLFHLEKSLVICVLLNEELFISDIEVELIRTSFGKSFSLFSLISGRLVFKRVGLLDILSFFPELIASMRLGNLQLANNDYYNSIGKKNSRIYEQLCIGK
ncbi:hypothetical protein BpHYR1_051527 [Brachionus plicatilis]|uniref:Uncharacterized protein n=1 Tax=Brachionus plicatilis TaxID=10195 RepID=A0A3M7R8Y0_BRAPC|nr:hypothetical protein BpHYR1_051527 [Brachionus plicatilis]